MSVGEVEEGGLRVETQDPLTGWVVRVAQTAREVARLEQSTRPVLWQVKTGQQVAF